MPSPRRNFNLSDPSERRQADERPGKFHVVRGGRGKRPRGARRRGRVLIVEDNGDSRELYALYFDLVGYDALTAADGYAGVEVAMRRMPDVIVMDLAMPGMSGVEAIRRLKTDARTRKIPIILLTGYHARAIEEGALEAGAKAFLTKPCLPEDLEAQVRRVMERRRK